MPESFVYTTDWARVDCKRRGSKSKNRAIAPMKVGVKNRQRRACLDRFEIGDANEYSDFGICRTAFGLSSSGAKEIMMSVTAVEAS